MDRTKESEKSEKKIINKTFERNEVTRHADAGKNACTAIGFA